MSCWDWEGYVSQSSVECGGGAGLQDLLKSAIPWEKDQPWDPALERHQLRASVEQPRVEEQLLELSKPLWALVSSSVNLCLQDSSGLHEEEIQIGPQTPPKQRCLSVIFLGKRSASSLNPPLLPEHPPRPTQPPEAFGQSTNVPPNIPTS